MMEGWPPPSPEARLGLALEHSNAPLDPEFGSRAPGPLGGDLGGEPEAYLRVAANPFLSLTFLVIWLTLLYEAAFGGVAGPLTPMFVVILLMSVVIAPYLLQYHCLDCGATGRLTRWDRHVCHKALSRREAGQRRRFRGPTPPAQVILWIWLIVTLAAVYRGLLPRLGMP